MKRPAARILVIAASMLGGATAIGAAPPASANWRLTVNGLGPIKIGMTVAQASRSSGTVFRDTGDYEGECRTFSAAQLPRVSLMVEAGRITTIAIYQDGNGPVPAMKTDRGLGLHDSEAKAARLYPDARRVTDDYVGVRYFLWPQRNRGLRYDVTDGRVGNIEVGTRSIEYTEGCS